jgi:hypothetical protein
MTISARYANAAETDVALEIDGAIFAVKPDDPRLEGVEVGAYELPQSAPPPPAPVSGRQFKAALAIAGLITEAEMVSRDLPAIVLPALAGRSVAERIIARATWAELSEVRGDEPLLLLFAAIHTPPLGTEDIAALMATARAIP